MLDNDFKINKEEYPLEIVYVSDKKVGYLQEGQDEYRPFSEEIPIFAPIYLNIIPPLTYNFEAGEFSSAAFHAKAKIALTEHSIFFFGTNRKIEEIDVKIFPTDKKMHLEFTGDISQEHEDYDYTFTEEYIFISMAIKKDQFEKVLRAWEQDNIDEMFFSIKKEQINGLYQLNTYGAPYFKYKVLPNKRMIKNYQDMPQNFTDFANSKTYYVSDDCFNLTLRRQRFRQRIEI